MGRVPRRLLVPSLLLVVLLASCSSSPDSAGSTAPTGGPPTATASTGGSESSSPSPAPERETILPKDGSFVAIPRERYTPMWKQPSNGKQPDFALDTQNDFGELVPMLIEHATMREGEPWYEVLMPIRPNGSSAWVRDSDVKVRQRDDRLEVDLSSRTLVRYHDDQVVDRFKVGIGTDQYPTTTGQFYVYIKVPYDNPDQPYGIMALGLSGFSRVITDWPGGGRIAVHGTPYASNRGDAVSHGCVRVYNQDMEGLVDLPLGTPVEIHA
jgi:L,D-transpeptidase-like protein